MRALVIDPGGSRSALAGVRALGRAGVEVGVASPVRGLAAGSRRCSSFVLVGSSVDAEELAGVVRAGGWDVVVPAGDAEAFLVSRERAALGCRVPYAPHDVVARALDKAALAEVATACGVVVPAVVDGPPAVVKGRSHVEGRQEAVVARTAAEFRDAVAAFEDPVVQELVDGPLVSFSVVVDEAGSVLARVQQEALAVWPSGAGVSTRAVTVPVDVELSAGVDRLVAALGWVGLGQMQFLVGRDGVPKLIDFNGRLYGSLSLALAAGVNLPALWVGAPGAESEAAEARVGTRYQWLEGDLRRSGGRAGAVAESVRFGLGAAHSIWSAEDPAPLVHHGWALAKRAARKAGRVTGVRR